MTTQSNPPKSPWNHWVILALCSGLFAAMNGVFAKLSVPLPSLPS